MFWRRFSWGDGQNVRSQRHPAHFHDRRRWNRPGRKNRRRLHRRQTEKADRTSTRIADRSRAIAQTINSVPRKSHTAGSGPAITRSCRHLPGERFAPANERRFRAGEEREQRRNFVHSQLLLVWQFENQRAVQLGSISIRIGEFREQLRDRFLLFRRALLAIRKKFGSRLILRL